MKYQQFPHQASVTIKDQLFQVYWSGAANQQLENRSQPLIVEMELKFACMARLLVPFHEQADGVITHQIIDKLAVFYQLSVKTVMSMLNKAKMKIVLLAAW